MTTLNSVYESYHRISDRYFVLQRNQETGQYRYIWQTHAKPIIIPGFEDYDFFILRKESGYAIFEGLTGTMVLIIQRGKTMDLRRKDRREISKWAEQAIVKRGGRATINQAIVNLLMNGKKPSPRYQKTITLKVNR